MCDTEGRFLYARGDTSQLFGRPSSELPGLRLSEVIGKYAAEDWAARLARTLAGETIMVREQHRETLFSLMYYPIRAPEPGTVYAAGYAQDVTRLGSAEQELRATTLRMLKAQESERGRLAKFLHDEVGQSLSAAGLHLDLLRMDFETISPEIKPRTAELQQMLENVMAGVRDFSYELNPDIVERAGLHAAMDRLVGRARKRFTGNVRLMDDSTLRFPPAVGSGLYKIAAEALDNAMQHAACTQIEVIIKSSPDGPALEVRDNGKGFDTVDYGGPQRGLGLLVMDHYAEQAGLRLWVRSRKGKGTVVRAVWPVVS